jgi:putative oxidoreductase
MRKLTIGVRILMGLVFVFAGVSFFLTTPPPLPEGAMADFFKGMMGTHYFFNLLKVTEIICGLLLLSGMFVPLALVVLAPIILNIFMVHLMMMPSGLPLALAVGACEIYLAFFSAEYSPTIKQLFRKK